jgi:hypothetical protein
LKSFNLMDEKVMLLPHSARWSYPWVVSAKRLSESTPLFSLSVDSSLMDSISMLVVRVFLFLRSCKGLYKSNSWAL